VFFVEDGEMLRSLGVKILSRLGYRVRALAGGNEMLAALRAERGPVHLLITDVILAGMNGRELAERARAERPGIRVLYCSGYTGNVIAHHGILDDGIDFIGKPYAPAELAAREVLDRP
jgi:two-component system cell cycle sensor histidine kinase/response regulator CckA